MAVCQVETMRLYPGADLNKIDAFQIEPAHQFLRSCMRAKGYMLTLSAADCFPQRNFTIQSSCYTADDWFSAALLYARAWYAQAKK